MMNIISCENCSVVLDKNRLRFPDDIYQLDGSVDEQKAAWDGENWVARVFCPVCYSDILESNKGGDMYYYESMRYFTPYRQECHNLAEAVSCALADLETGEAWPKRILNGQTVMWKQSGPMQTYDSLEVFANANGVEHDLLLRGD